MLKIPKIWHNQKEYIEKEDEAKQTWIFLKAVKFLLRAAVMETGCSEAGFSFPARNKPVI